MSKIKESLEANKATILAALTPDLQTVFENQLAAEPDEDPTPLSGDAEIVAIKAEIINNPAVDENAAASALTDIKIPEPVTPMTDTELEAEKTDLLTKAKTMASNTAAKIEAKKAEDAATKEGNRIAEQAAAEREARDRKLYKELGLK